MNRGNLEAALHKFLNDIASAVAVAQNQVLESPDFFLKLIESLVQGLVASSDNVSILDSLERLKSLLLTALGGCHAVAFQELLTLGLGRLLFGRRVLAQLGQGLSNTDILGGLFEAVNGHGASSFSLGFCRSRCPLRL